jgi:hypothetical protein
MNTRQLLQLESLTNSLAILRDPAFRRPDLNGLRVKLEKETELIRNLFASQEGNRIGRGVESAQVVQLRRDIRKRLLRISSFAMVTLEGLPGIREDVRLPRANAKDADLLAGVARLLKNLRPHLKALYGAGLPRETITRLEASARSLKAKLSTSDTAIARLGRSTRLMPDAIRRGRAIVKAIEMTIRLDFGNDPNVMAKWDRATRIPKKTGRPRKRRPIPPS